MEDTTLQIRTVSKQQNSFPAVKIDNRPADYDYACMSQQVYEPGLIGGETLPENSDWKIKETRAGEHHYFGVIYVNAKTKQVVLAHRGTNSLDACVEDLKGIYANRRETSHKAAVFSFIDQAITYCQQPYEQGYSDRLFQLSFTGHSLGAFLAELSVYYCQRSKEQYPAHAVTFESPGCRESLEKLQPEHADGQVDLNNLDVISYLSYPNIVNTCNHHIGTLYTLAPEIKTNSGIFSRLLQNIVSYAISVDNQRVLQIHAIAGIVQQLKNLNSMPRYIFDWPVGSQRTYFFKYAHFENGLYTLENDSNLASEIANSYQSFETDYKAHYRVDEHLTSKNLLPLKHFSVAFRGWLENFYANLWQLQRAGEFDPQRLIAAAQKIGIEESLMTGFLSFAITQEQNGLKFFRVLDEQSGITVFSLRRTLSDFLEREEFLANQLFNLTCTLLKPSVPDIHLIAVEQGADTREFDGKITQKGTRVSGNVKLTHFSN